MKLAQYPVVLLRG